MVKIGIIGGKGKMGRWFDDFFSFLGHDVLISDIGTELKNHDVVKRAEVVIFSLPLQIAHKVVDEVSKFTRKDQLLIDITAIKKNVVESLEKTNSEVLSIHPMFGPSVSTMRGQTVVVCDIRTKKWKGWLEDIILDNEGKIKQTEPEHHDWMMAIIQGLTHFSLISLGHTLKELGIDIHESLEFTSPIYKIRLDMVGRIFSQDPVLYSDISLENDNTKIVLDALKKSSDKLFKIVLERDHRAFVKYFADSAYHLGKYKEEAMESSKFLVKKLATRGSVI